MPVAPTLLIGLGGVGSSIVDRVYGWIEDKENLEVRVMDTDVNWMQKRLKNLNESQIIQTSENITVGRYLDNDKNALEWFPSHDILNKKLLVDGAGQVRAVSRLALRAAMKTGKLDSLVTAIENLMKLEPGKLDTGYKVMIVSSMVGGTGSGMFLQIPLFIRDLFQERGIEKVLIRGVFLMPDIFDGTVPKKQLSNIKANAYAALKELNAITLAASGDSRSKVTIELEYKPNMIESSGASNYEINQYRLPYDFCFMFDKQNDQGKILPGTEAYIEQVSKCVHTLCASPISHSYNSVEDNMILDLIRNRGINRFCGIATASIKYPYGDLVEYCSLQWISNNLQESWLKLDNMYSKEYDEYIRAVRRGEDREKPKKSESYISNFNSIINSEGVNNFYKILNKQVLLNLEKGVPSISKSVKFIDEMRNRVSEAIGNDPFLNQILQECRLDEEQLKLDRNRARNTIASFEDALNTYREEIKKKIRDYSVNLANDIVLGDVEHQKVSGHEGIQYRLNTWILGKNEPIHPVAQRYLLYLIKSQMKQELLELSDKNNSMLDTISRYDRSYNDPETDIVETPVDLVNNIYKDDFFSKITSILSSKKSEFVDIYIQRSQKQLKLLNLYKVNKLTEEVYYKVINYINVIISELENFFESLESIKVSLENKIKFEEEKHDNLTDISTSWVLTEKEIKKKVWNVVNKNLLGEFEYGDLSREIYLSLYKQGAKKIMDDRYESIDGATIFEKSIMNFAKEFIEKEALLLKMDVVEAIRYEAQLKEISRDRENDYITKAIQGLTNRARPYTPKKEVADIEDGVMVFERWGVNGKALKSMSQDMSEKLFGNHKEVSDEFTQHEIQRLLLYAGMKATDFPKFKAAQESNSSFSQNGDYFEHYMKRIKLLNDKGVSTNELYFDKPEDTVTPHIDVRWHKPAYLPDINEHIQQMVGINKISAFVRGLAYGWILFMEEQGITSMLYLGRTNTKRITVAGKVVEARIDYLFDSLYYNPAIVDEINENAVLLEDKDFKNNLDIKKHKFIKGLMNLENPGILRSQSIIDILFEYRMSSARG
jgi:hypothetical protein